MCLMKWGYIYETERKSTKGEGKEKRTSWLWMKGIGNSNLTSVPLKKISIASSFPFPVNTSTVYCPRKESFGPQWVSRKLKITQEGMWNEFLSSSRSIKFKCYRWNGNRSVLRRINFNLTKMHYFVKHFHDMSEKYQILHSYRFD